MSVFCVSVTFSDKGRLEYICTWGVFSLILRVGTSRTTIYTFWITMSGFLIERIANVIV